MEENNGGFHIDKSSVDCNFCRCGKKALYEETKQQQIKRVML